MTHTQKLISERVHVAHLTVIKSEPRFCEKKGKNAAFLSHQLQVHAEVTGVHVNPRNRGAHYYLKTTLKCFKTPHVSVGIILFIFKWNT